MTPWRGFPGEGAGCYLSRYNSEQDEFDEVFVKGFRPRPRRPLRASPGVAHLSWLAFEGTPAGLPSPRWAAAYSSTTTRTCGGKAEVSGEKGGVGNELSIVFPARLLRAIHGDECNVIQRGVCTELSPMPQAPNPASTLGSLHWSSARLRPVSSASPW